MCMWAQIYQRQLMKQELSKSVVDGGGGGEQGPGQFSVDELRQLFRVRQLCVVPDVF